MPTGGAIRRTVRTPLVTALVLVLAGLPLRGASADEPARPARPAAPDAGHGHAGHTDAVTPEEARAIARWETAQRERRRAERRLEALEDDLDAARLDLLAADIALDAAATRVRDIGFRRRVLTAEMREVESDLDALAVQMYMHGGADAGFVVTPGSAIEAGAGQTYLQAQRNDRQAVMDRYAALRREIDRLRRAAAAEERAAGTAREQRARQVAAVGALRDAQAEERAAAARAARAARSTYDRLKRDRVQHETRIVSYLQSSNAVRTMLATLQADQWPAGDRYRLRVRPVPGVIASGFGYRVHPVLHTKRWHMGVDMDGDQGSPVVAAADGVVVYAGSRSGYGNTIIVDHGNQVATLNAHLSVMRVREGARVRAGDTIGLVGSTGMSTGPHLHFEVRRLGVPHNPLDYLPVGS